MTKHDQCEDGYYEKNEVHQKQQTDRFLWPDSAEQDKNNIIHVRIEYRVFYDLRRHHIFFMWVMQKLSCSLWIEILSTHE